MLISSRLPAVSRASASKLPLPPPYLLFHVTVLWVNLCGSLFLGVLAEKQRLLRYSVASYLPVNSKEEIYGHKDCTKTTFPLYISLACGFCCSFVSFFTSITNTLLLTLAMA